MTKLSSLIRDLTKAKKRLEEAAKLKPTRIHKDAVIQRFEFCFELTWKMLQAYIRDQGLDCGSPKNCLRTAAQIGLIKNLKKWFLYLDARNLVSHTYNEKLADKVYSHAVKFPSSISDLLKKIKE